MPPVSKVLLAFRMMTCLTCRPFILDTAPIRMLLQKRKTLEMSKVENLKASDSNDSLNSVGSTRSRRNRKPSQLLLSKDIITDFSTIKAGASRSKKSSNSSSPNVETTLPQPKSNRTSIDSLNNLSAVGSKDARPKKLSPKSVKLHAHAVRKGSPSRLMNLVPNKSSDSLPSDGLSSSIPTPNELPNKNSRGKRKSAPPSQNSSPRSDTRQIQSTSTKSANHHPAKLPPIRAKDSPKKQSKVSSALEALREEAVKMREQQLETILNHHDNRIREMYCLDVQGNILDFDVHQAKLDVSEGMVEYLRMYDIQAKVAEDIVASQRQKAAGVRTRKAINQKKEALATMITLQPPSNNSSSASSPAIPAIVNQTTTKAMIYHRQYHSVDDYLNSFVYVDGDKEIHPSEISPIIDRIAQIYHRRWELAEKGITPVGVNASNLVNKQLDMHPVGARTHRWYLLNEMAWLVKHRYSKSIRLTGAKKVAKLIERYWEQQKNINQRQAKEERRRIRQLAKKTAQAVKAKWKLIETLVRHKYKALVQEEQTRRGKQHLNMIIQHSTAVLGAQQADLIGRNESLGSTPVSTPRSSRQSMTPDLLDADETSHDDGFSDASESEDGGDAEVDNLQNEMELPIEELLKKYNLDEVVNVENGQVKTSEEYGNEKIASDGSFESDEEATSDDYDSVSEEESGEESLDEGDEDSEDPTSSADMDLDVSSLVRCAESDASEITSKKSENSELGSEMDLQQSLPESSSFEATLDDAEFDYRAGMSDDDDLIEDESSSEDDEEMVGLQDDMDVPVEELLKKYGYMDGDNIGNETESDGESASEDSATNDDDESNEQQTEPLSSMDTKFDAAALSEIAVSQGGESIELQDDEFALGSDEESIDNEETLDAEESFSEDDDVEVKGLEDDLDLPIEELLQKYGYLNSNDTDDSDDDIEEGKDEQEEVEDNETHIADSDSELSRSHRRQTSVDEEMDEVPQSESVAKAADSEELNNHDGSDAVQLASGTALDDSIVQTPIPILLRGTLREYQHAGLDWLAALYNNNLNGILADEMGLGKTIQTIALLAHLACQHGVWGPHLIVVPTSVMLNWEVEFKKWCPGFKILTYYGNQKERKEKRIGWTKENAFHVCITSYQLVISDQTVFRRKQWQYLILDEAHNIKNFRSQRWQTLLNFSSKRRLLLTGTPLQNNLMELWSLLYFLMPNGATSAVPMGFANQKEFQEWFSKPVDAAIDASQPLDPETRAAVSRLHTILRPYLLRRLKSEVEKQMPAKYEHIVYCRLSKRQRFLYDDFMSRAQTRETLASGNFLSIINCLMQLRKVCNHPDMFEVRPIVTSFAISKSVAAEFEITDLLVRRRLLQSSPSSLLSDSSPSSPSISTHSRNGSRPSSPVSIKNLESEIKIETVYSRPTFNDLASLGLIITGNELTMSKSFIPDLARLNCNKVFQRKIEAIESQISVRTLQKPPNYSSLREYGRLLRQRELNSSRERWLVLSNVNKQRMLNSQNVIYGFSLIQLAANITIAHPSAQNIHSISSNPRRYFDFASPLIEMVQPLSRRTQNMMEIVQKYAFVTPKVKVASRYESVADMDLLKGWERENFKEDIFHPIQNSLSIAFPDRWLLQYDCGKLQKLDELLRELKAGDHRVLIFTQMTKVLDILEIFLNLHGYRYLRLDGATKPEQRQLLTERFNTDRRIMVFISSTRAGGIGINLTSADTVVFYDSDWNPSMDAQAQDRVHRIGQTRDVHIYRLISAHTIEENILRKAQQKRMLDNIVIQEGAFNTEVLKKLEWEDNVRTDSLDQIAFEKVLGGTQKEKGALDEKELEQALVTVEDQEDVAALKQTKKEMASEMVEFDEKISREEDQGDAKATIGSVVRTTSSNPLLSDEADDVGGIEDYMFKFKCYEIIGYFDPRWISGEDSNDQEMEVS
ncbi:SNF2 family N-terminal domain-containing protein [Paraphysoderma sedebokerense]|nr:SNF2 family N-terminal domain-containing protein [Paraphysoderma sedebokerense]